MEKVSTHSSNKRIMKNTFFMYFRMAIAMIVTLYTSRIVLRELGVDDYGVYNVIGGIVIVFSFVNGAMTSSTSRFLSHAIGSGNIKEIDDIFGNTITLHLGLSVIVIFLSETIGMWYLYNIMVLPDLGNTIQVVYQCSIINIIVIIIGIPFSSIIISYEKMNIYAYLTVIDVLMKLGIAYSLMYFENFKLEVYAILQVLTSAFILISYCIFCFKKHLINNLMPRVNINHIKSMISFSSWSLYSCGGSVATTQGVNLILNSFFGVIVNAAYGITTQIQGAVNRLSLNFQIAMNPQIVKTYSSKEFDKHHHLVGQSAKFSAFLIMILIIPIYYNLKDILDLWLVTYPEETIIFSKLALFNSLIVTIANPFGVSVEASGKIGRMTFVYSTIAIFTLPLIYFVLRKTHIPSLAFFIILVSSCITLIVKLYYCVKICKFPIRFLWKIYLLPIFTVLLIVTCCCSIINVILTNHFVVNLIIDFVIVFIFILLIGLNDKERNFILSLTKARFVK